MKLRLIFFPPPQRGERRGEQKKRREEENSQAKEAKRDAVKTPKPTPLQGPALTKKIYFIFHFSNQEKMKMIMLFFLPPPVYTQRKNRSTGFSLLLESIPGCTDHREPTGWLDTIHLLETRTRDACGKDGCDRRTSVNADTRYLVPKRCCSRMLHAMPCQSSIMLVSAFHNRAMRSSLMRSCAHAKTPTSSPHSIPLFTCLTDQRCLPSSNSSFGRCVQPCIQHRPDPALYTRNRLRQTPLQLLPRPRTPGPQLAPRACLCNLRIVRARVKRDVQLLICRL